MADIEYNESRPKTQETQETQSNVARWGILVGALVLAALIGFGAVDAQHNSFGPGTENAGGQQTDTRLDGRGKWGGYLN